MTNEYEENGYFVFKNIFNDDDLQGLREVLLDFHELWKRKNAQLYADRAVNSAYITGTEHLDEIKRTLLFRFIGSSKLMDAVASVMSRRPTFMNTQLFFNPASAEQKNYWHRDPQYHLSIEEQKEALAGSEVIHFRIPLIAEPGVELVPGTHRRWDTNEELDVRLENNGRKNHDHLSTGVRVELDAGDLLVFSANMIHRGLYGMDRLSFDILFCDPDPNLMKYVSDDCLPNKEIIRCLENADAFESAIEIKTNNKAILI